MRTPTRQPPLHGACPDLCQALDCGRRDVVERLVGQERGVRRHQHLAAGGALDGPERRATGGCGARAARRGASALDPHRPTCGNEISSLKRRSQNLRRSSGWSDVQSSKNSEPARGGPSEGRGGRIRGGGAASGRARGTTAPNRRPAGGWQGRSAERPPHPRPRRRRGRRRPGGRCAARRSARLVWGWGRRTRCSALWAACGGLQARGQHPCGGGAATAAAGRAAHLSRSGRRARR
jgi:hypothetical protein